MCKNFENWSSNRNFCLPYKKIQKQVNKNQEIHFFGHFWIDTRFHLLYQPLDTPNFFQGFEILMFLSCKNIIFFLQGVSKKCKNRICLISREPRNIFLNHFFSSENWDPEKTEGAEIFCICKPKWDYETDTIILVMTWSGLSSARLASRCPSGPCLVPSIP